MAEILSLREIFQKEGISFINQLFEEKVLIVEKINGTRFCVQKNQDGSLSFFKKDGKITMIDRSLVNLYESPIRFFESIDKSIIDELSTDLRYGFRYFHDLNGEGVPSLEHPNGLVLTDIKHVRGNVIEDVKELHRVSTLLRVNRYPIIWEGSLNRDQKKNLLDYLNTPETELISKFKTESFTKYMISILNPKLKDDFLDPNRSIESVIFKFISKGEGSVVYAKIMDPRIYQINKDAKKTREAQDLYGIILSDIVEFVKLNGLKKYTLTKSSKEERYLELICSIFNDYLKKMSYRYEGIEMNPQSFAATPSFELNSGFITDLKTRELISNSSINRHIFKILMSSFNKPKKKVSGTLTQMLINDTIDISNKIKDLINTETKKEKSSFPTFEEFFLKKEEKRRIIPD